MAEKEFMGETSPTESETSFEGLFEGPDFAETDTTGNAKTGDRTQVRGGAEEETPTRAAEENAEERPEGEEKLPPLSMQYNGRRFTISGEAAKELSEATEIPLEELGVLIQKGMNYDNAIRRTPLHRTMEKFARANGMEMPEYQELLEKNAEKILLERELRAIRRQHPALDEETARELAEGRLARQRETGRQGRDVETALRKAWERQRQEWESQERQRREELERSRIELARARQLLRNRQTSVGSLSQGADVVERDPFLEGLGF